MDAQFLVITLVVIIVLFIVWIFILYKRNIVLYECSKKEPQMVTESDISQFQKHIEPIKEQITSKIPSFDLCEEIKPLEEVNDFPIEQCFTGNEFSDFENTFLVKRANIPRRQCYMSQDVYEQVSKYLYVIAGRMTVTAYVDNVMRHHMEQYKEEINRLYKINTKKPL